MAIPAVIYCAAGNPEFVRIATNSGMAYGAQLPGTVYQDIGRLYFADQNWKRPSRYRYVEAITRARPHMASVLDWERPEQLPEVLAWAEDVAPHVEVVMVIPKVVGGVSRIPAVIGGRPVRLGYSVPTRHGGTDLPVWEFGRRPVHLLGGSPHAQMRISPYLNVLSVDGNYHQKMAVQFCQFWQPGTATYARNRWWPRLDEAGDRVTNDAPAEAFRRSCHAIMEAWRNLTPPTP